MSILSACLITFIGTVIFIGSNLVNDCYLVDKEFIKKNKIIVFKDGSIWRKDETQS